MGQCELLLPMQCVRGKVGKVMSDFSEIQVNLWQGGSGESEWDGSATRPRATIHSIEQFESVVTLDSSTPPVGWLTKELRFGFADGEIDPETFEEIERVADWAFLEWRNGKRVLVRCQAGLNRSGLVVGLVLLRSGKKFSEVIDLIRSQRGEYALSNRQFYEYLEGWGKR